MAGEHDRVGRVFTAEDRAGDTQILMCASLWHQSNFLWSVQVSEVVCLGWGTPLNGLVDNNADLSPAFCLSLSSPSSSDGSRPPSNEHQGPRDGSRVSFGRSAGEP